MLLLQYAMALGLTLAVEVPLYAVALTWGWRVPWVRAAGVAVAVNLVTHPVLWWTLLPLTSRPGYGWIMLIAEIAVCLVEWLLLSVLLRRRDPLLLVLSVAANAASVAAGVAALRVIGSVG